MSGMDDESAAKLVDALALHRNLRYLSLCFHRINGTSEKWTIALGNLLQNQTPKVEELDLGQNDIEDKGGVALARGALG